MNTTLKSADFALHSQSSMRKINILVRVAVALFLVFFLYGLQAFVNSGQQLAAIKEVHFPLLQQIDDTIVNIDRIEALMNQALLSGDVEELSYSREAYIHTNNLLTQIRERYPEQNEAIVALQNQFDNYFTVAKNTTQLLLVNGGKDALNQSEQMNQLLLDLRQHFVVYRGLCYQNFLTTLDESRKTSALNFYMSIGLGVFVVILVYFIRLHNRYNHAISDALDQVGTLLNESGQGFFSFGPDLQIVGEYSQACVAMLGQIPAGRGADELLFPFTSASGVPNRNLMRSCIEDALEAKSAYVANMFLELIPAELVINRNTLRVQYIPIKAGFLVVLSNITAEVELRKIAEQESKNARMILGAVTEGPEFLAIIDDFISFCKSGPKPWLKQEVSSLCRVIHTFKGSFNQLSFTHVPAALHEVESFLQDLTCMDDLLSDDSAVGIVEFVFENKWRTLLNRDIAVVTAALGDNYFAHGGVIPLNIKDAKALEKMAKELLSTKIVSVDHELLLIELAKVRYISLHEELADFNKLVHQLAVKLEKEMQELQISGDDVRLDPDIYRHFLLTLGHVIRNAIDHGIEDSRTRHEKGKDEVGTIRCKTSLIANEFELIIQDDGAGINEAALRLRASEKQGANVDSLTLAELVFSDGFSSRESVTELSGRGIGMAAVRAEVLLLGGTVTIENVPEVGARFIFRIPLLKDIAA